MIFVCDRYSLEGMCEDELPASRLSKVIVLQPENACIYLGVVTFVLIT